MTAPASNTRGLFVTGTDTGVGKTLVTAAVTMALRSQGVQAGIMKPIATGLADGPAGLSDPDWLLSITHTSDALELVNPYRFQPSAAPLVAATAEGVTIDTDRIIQAFHTLSSRHDMVVVEGIGGILVPLTRDLFVVDLIKRMGLPAMVVARSGLGSINHTLLTLDCLRARGVPILGVIFNTPGRPAAGPDRSETMATIVRLSGVRSFGELPYCGGLPGAWDTHRDTLIKRLDVQGLLEALGLRATA